ncbi:hypothetical protein HDV00_012463 [Rhizophlyctis rosea]|nr:hypothetical protein HDV00_012463 [Rhizophlyctis rosea]
MAENAVPVVPPPIEGTETRNAFRRRFGAFQLLSQMPLFRNITSPATQRAAQVHPQTQQQPPQPQPYQPQQDQPAHHPQQPQQPQQAVQPAQHPQPPAQLQQAPVQQQPQQPPQQQQQQAEAECFVVVRDVTENSVDRPLFRMVKNRHEFEEFERLVVAKKTERMELICVGAYDVEERVVLPDRFLEDVNLVHIRLEDVIVPQSFLAIQATVSLKTLIMMSCRIANVHIPRLAETFFHLETLVLDMPLLAPGELFKLVDGIRLTQDPIPKFKSLSIYQLKHLTGNLLHTVSKFPLITDFLFTYSKFVQPEQYITLRNAAVARKPHLKLAVRGCDTDVAKNAMQHVFGKTITYDDTPVVRFLSVVG